MKLECEMSLCVLKPAPTLICL